MDGVELRITLLGGFHVYVGAEEVKAGRWRLRKAKSLLKVLALTPGHRLHREQAIDLLWPETSPEAALNSLHYALHSLRHTLEPGRRRGTSTYLHLHDDLILLYPASPLTIDVERFESAVATARRGQDPACYETALALYTGDLLPEDRYEDWAAPRRDGLRSLSLRLLREIASLYEARGEQSAAIGALERLAAVEPTAEEAQVALMRLYALRGWRQQALQQYQMLADALRYGLDIEPNEDSRRLYQEILDGRFSAITAPSPDVSIQTIVRRAASSSVEGSGNLPSPVNGFVGRRKELATTQARLHGTRLLTLTGAGGCGKTRLALEVARQMQTQYRDGVWLADLSTVTNPELVPQAVAAVLGVREQPDRLPVDTLVWTLRDRHLLLVLDNCEHLVDAAAGLVERLLHGCPDLRVLATSRVALRIDGETTWRVPPLDLPTAGQPLSPEILAHCDAVRLFVERAAASRPGFTLTAENAAAVADLCRRLDGIPLALELAAARVSMLPVEILRERLDDRFRLLSCGSRMALPRHQTLRATMDWSYALLSRPAQVVLSRLAVFGGGWTLDTAEVVCAGGEIARDDVLDLLGQLVEHSLVIVDENGRYRLLETVRQYAAEHLRAAGEETAVRAKLAGWCVAFAERAESLLAGREQAIWLERLEAEHDNVRAALRWSTDDGADRTGQALGLRLAKALGKFWLVRGYVSEGRAWLEQALARNKDDVSAMTGVRAYALSALGDTVREQGDLSGAASLYEQSLDVFRRQDDAAGVALALNSLGATAVRQGHFARAASLYEESLTLARAVGDTRRLVAVLGSLGEVASSQGEHQRARALSTESLALARQIGDHGSIALSLCNLGNGAYRRGEYARATAFYEDGLSSARVLGDKSSIALLLNNLGAVARDQGYNDRARVLLEESLELRRQVGDKRGMAVSLCTLGMVAGAEDGVDRAVALFDESLTLAREIGDKWSIGRVLCAQGRMACRTGDHERALALYEESLTLYHGMRDTIGVATALEGFAALRSAQGCPEQAARLLGAVSALRAATNTPLCPADRPVHERVLAGVRAALGTSAFMAAWTAGTRLPLETIVARALVTVTVPQPVAEAAMIHSLTPRERQIAVLIARGHTNRDIATTLGMANRTVDTHVRNILKKLELPSRLEVAALIAAADTDVEAGVRKERIRTRTA